MWTIPEIYEAYHIMPNLQMHQLRVAAVGKRICDHFSGELDSQAVILACLFHDMGNIIKFDLNYFPKFLEPQGKAYWESVKADYLHKYGADEHAASNEIAKELGLPEHVRILIDEVRFSRLALARDSADFEGKIVKYSDLRVSPFSVVSVMDRLEEGKGRYATKKQYETPEGVARYEAGVEAAQAIEQQIFECCSIRPEEINDETVAPLIEELRNYSLA
ncbi:MAG: HD domain-containing protein [Candidatus Pacebacteria bacterium]|nr:HD domain-containing protein [Candidatus Paceibacterota bacterium]